LRLASFNEINSSDCMVSPDDGSKVSFRSVVCF
jgi:hypothetical protein